MSQRSILACYVARNTLLPLHEISALIDELFSLSSKIDLFNEYEELSPYQEGQREILKKEVCHTCKQMGLHVEFNYDPRAAAVRIIGIEVGDKFPCLD